MTIFFMALAAYIVGWLLCNLFFVRLIQRDKRSQRMACRRIAEEYFRLAKGVRSLPVDPESEEEWAKNV
ncbi:MAG: hypothetical protein H0V67_09915 [Geodermatophilaceae bacterium]|nr:hypothetical protein [Geodermatophilaceae bacterium]